MSEGGILTGAFLDALQALDLYLHQPVNGHYSGERPSRAYGSSTEFADYRDYVPGDDLRRIDWNLAGRFDKYYIKRFMDEKQARNRIYLDGSASMGQDGKDLTALRLAAALGYLSVANMDSVSYRLLSGSGCAALTDHISGKERFFQGVQKLEKVAFQGTVDLGRAVPGDADPGLGDGVSYILSDLLTQSDWKGAVKELLGRGRQVAVVQVLSPEELEPSVRGALGLWDVEDGKNRLRVEVDRSALKAYSQAVDFFLQDIRRFCAAHQVGYMMVRSDERVEEVLLTKGCAEELIR